MNSIHTKIILFSICFCLSTTFLRSQDLSLHLSVANKTLSNIELLDCNLELQNNGDSTTIRRVKISLQSSMGLQYYDEISSSWIDLNYSGFSVHDRFGFVMPMCFLYERDFFIKANQSINKKLDYSFLKDYNYGSNDYLFDNGEIVRIRGVFRLRGNEKLVYSNEEEITFTKYSGEDSLALCYLESLAIPHFIYEPIYEYSVYKRIEFTGIEEAKYLVKNYPNSKFACWAYLYLTQEELNYVNANSIVFYNYKDALKDAENYIKKALELKDNRSIKTVKQLYEKIIHSRFQLGLYNENMFEYVELLEYINEL